MIFRWESEEERLQRLMKISPKKKMEWLSQMNEFLNKTSTSSRRDIRRRLREAR